jgi:cell division protein ZapA
MEDLTITVNIADRPYRLKVRSDEEEIIRKAAKLINERIREYSDLYAFNDRQDLLSMTVLHYATSALNLEQKTESESGEIIEKLKEINTKLSRD